MSAMALAIVTALLGGAGDPYVWPLDGARIVTSSFGEYRGGRFHAGLDLRTGSTGRDVLAPAAGHVSRIRCSPWGYGKAVYLKLDDGNTAVFGHLSDFAPALRDYVRQAQHAAKNYTVDLEPKSGQFKFNAGDIIAATGDTGIGPAHLHYELRDSRGRPMNPRLAGVSWPDTTAPVLRKVAVVPAGPGALVNGDVTPVVLECKAGKPGEYACARIRARGRIGIGADLLDPANAGANKLGIYSLRTFANGQEVFGIRFDTFSYEESRYETVAYHPFLSERGLFLLQWRWPGNDCGIFANGNDTGWIDMSGEPVEMRVEAEDFMGNMAAVAFTVDPDDGTEQPAPAASASDKKGTLSIDCAGTWLIVTAKFPDPEAVAPVLHVEGAADPCSLRRIGRRTFRTAVAPAPDATELAIAAQHARLDPAPQHVHVFHRGNPIRAVNVDAAEITVNAGSPYGVLFLRADTVESGDMPVLRLWPDQTPIDTPVEIALPIAPKVADPSRAQVYRRGKNKWTPLPTRRVQDRLTTAVTEFGEFAIIEDTTPPTISDISISPRASQPARPGISARVSDPPDADGAASGIAAVNVYCNGQWLLAAYDPEAGRIEWERDQDLPPPPWEFTFTAVDNAGNEAHMTQKSSGIGP